MKVKAMSFGVFLLATGLALGGSNAWGADWRPFAEATTGIFQYDASSIRSPSAGVVRVWIHNVTKHETSLLDLNCRGGSYRVLDVVEYDEGGKVKNRSDYYDNPNWSNISPKSVPEYLRKVVCP